MNSRDLLAEMSAASGEKGVPSPLVSGRDPFSVLVGTVISLRTRDAVTEKVTRRVLRRADTPEKMVGISEKELAGLLRPAGFFNRKASQLKSLADILIQQYQGEVPSGRDALEALPGVGGKTAAFVLSMAFNIPAICVDVHVHRISNRLGIVVTRTPAETETALMKVFPEDLWITLNHVFVRFGQRVCLPGVPRCDMCSFKGWCKSAL